MKLHFYNTKKSFWNQDINLISIWQTASNLTYQIKFQEGVNEFGLAVIYECVFRLVSLLALYFQ